MNTCAIIRKPDSIVPIPLHSKRRTLKIGSSRQLSRRSTRMKKYAAAVLQQPAVEQGGAHPIEDASKRGWKNRELTTDTEFSPATTKALFSNFRKKKSASLVVHMRRIQNETNIYTNEWNAVKHSNMRTQTFKEEWMDTAVCNTYEN